MACINYVHVKGNRVIGHKYLGMFNGIAYYKMIYEDDNKMDNKQRMDIIEPQVPEGEAGKVAKKIFILTAIGAFLAFTWIWVKNNLKILHKIWHHFFPHVEDKNSEDMFKGE